MEKNKHMALFEKSFSLQALFKIDFFQSSITGLDPVRLRRDTVLVILLENVIIWLSALTP